MPFTFRHNRQVYLGIYQNAEPICLTRLGRNRILVYRESGLRISYTDTFSAHKNRIAARACK